MTYNSFSKRLKQSAFALFILWSSIGVAQGDLQQVLVETYYVSDAQDATTSVGGTLPEGSVTYRIFVTLCEGCALKAIYGDANHPFNIESTENFFNNDDRGKTWGHAIQDNRLNENTVALDSWLSFGGATDEDWGIPKPLDTDGSFVGGSNHEDGLLVNVTSEMGLALTEADGLLTAAATEPGNFFVSGTDASTIFGIETIGNAFSSTTFRAQADAFSIPETGNTFCIAQLTTNGELSFNLNIEVLNADGNLVKYVSSNELLLDGEVFSPFLSYPLDCGCTDPFFLEFDPAAACDDGSCSTPIIFGCNDPEACNYDPSVNFNVPELCCILPDNCVGLDSDLLCPGFVGVDDAAFDVLRVYPNPFTHAFTIDVPKSSDAQSFEVFSITGQMVLRGQLQAGTQSVLANELPNGMYVLRIFQATESYHFQIIKGL